MDKIIQITLVCLIYHWGFMDISSAGTASNVDQNGLKETVATRKNLTIIICLLLRGYIFGVFFLFYLNYFGVLNFFILLYYRTRMF